MELRRVHPVEDEILLQYLVPATCKAAAVLGMVSSGWRGNSHTTPLLTAEQNLPCRPGHLSLEFEDVHLGY